MNEVAKVSFACTPRGFPPDVQKVFDALRQEVTYMHSNWDAFQQLFGSQEAVDVLNQVAPGAFSLIGYNFRREFIVAACRMTDRKETGFGSKAKDNLTLKQLLHTIKQNCNDQPFLDRLSEMENEIDSHCRPIRERRNRVIAHLDLKTALASHPLPLPNVESKAIGEFLRLLAEFMNEINRYYASSHIDFVPVVTGPARNIVHALMEFQRLSKLDYEREIAELYKH